MVAANQVIPPAEEEGALRKHAQTSEEFRGVAHVIAPKSTTPRQPLAGYFQGGFVIDDIAEKS